MRIEALWQSLKTATPANAQTRVDADHPLDIYADLELPDRVGLVVVCTSKPPAIRPLRSLLIEEGRRADGRWALRLSLTDIALLPVFAALCQDIINFTRTGVDEARLGQVVLQRLTHWRTLMERDAAGLGDEALRGLIGELTVLRTKLIPSIGTGPAVQAWRGPYGAPQDFVLPDGQLLEVKTLHPQADRIRVNGLDQLDGGGALLTLVLVRAASVDPGAAGALTAPLLVDAINAGLVDDPEAQVAFAAALAELGWHEHPSHDALAVRIVSIREIPVTPDFPRLTRATVPHGILAADYIIGVPD